MSIIETLVSWMRSDNPRASVAACQALLDRAWGKAGQYNELTSEERGVVPAAGPTTEETTKAMVDMLNAYGNAKARGAPREVLEPMDRLIKLVLETS